MTLRNEIESIVVLRNSSPVDDFLGFSPNEIHFLLYDTFGDKSPLQFQDSIDDTILDQLPLFRIAEEFLKIIYRDKHIKLTPLGALPKKVMVEIYDKKLLLDDYIERGITKLWKEDDCISIKSARLSAELAGLVRKEKGKLILTKTGSKLLETNNRLQIFKQFFQAFTDKFLWSYNDGFPEHQVGQLGWGFSAIMLSKFGDQAQTIDFYAEKYLKAFPVFISFFGNEYSTARRQFYRCYGVRSFYRFFLWFGLITVDRQGKDFDTEVDKFERTDLLKCIFKIDE